MTDAKRAELVTRDTILKLLSNGEIAKVSSAEVASGLLTEGGEYLDLEHLDQGIQRAKAATNVTMGHVLPRCAVSDETWSKVLAQLARLMLVCSLDPFEATTAQGTRFSVFLIDSKSAAG